MGVELVIYLVLWFFGEKLFGFIPMDQNSRIITTVLWFVLWVVIGTQMGGIGHLFH